MRATFDAPALRHGLILTMLNLVFAGVWAPPVFAQAEETPSAATEVSGRNPGVPDSLPHFAYLVDYLLVAVLLAGALYAVCRSGPRV